jgi:hypothetical protein
MMIIHITESISPSQEKILPLKKIAGYRKLDSMVFGPYSLYGRAVKNILLLRLSSLNLPEKLHLLEESNECKY